MKEKMKNEMQRQQYSYPGKDWDKAPAKLEKIADLLFDWSIYPRKEVDNQVVRAYAKALQTGSIFPPIKVGLFKGQKIVIDGFHRAHSRILLKMPYIECKEEHFESEAELFAEAVRLNSSHGKTFTEIEVKANIRRLRRYNFEVKDIVSIVHIPASAIRQESTKPITILTLPSGKKLSCVKVNPGEHGVHGLICLKNALIIVSNWAEEQKIPDEPPFKELVARAREALQKVRCNA
jgi:plasmid stabilization system protein ParE